MDLKNGFIITNRDHILKSWQSSTELVRDYESYAHEIEHEDKNLAQLFSSYANDEARHAAQLLSLLKKYDSQ